MKNTEQSFAQLEVVSTSVKINITVSVPPSFLTEIEANTAFIRTVIDDMAKALDSVVDTVDII